MPVGEEYYTDAQGRRQKRKTGQDEDLVERENFDPSLRSKEKQSSEVEELGGLGAAEKKHEKTYQETDEDKAESERLRKRREAAKRVLGGLGSGH